MLLNADAKGLEWVGAIYLSQDKVGIEEIRNGYDPHEDNQRRFKLPSRLVAKTFLFKLIYGGSAYGFSRDAVFSTVGNESFWQRTIDATYNKYEGLHDWHERLVNTAIESGKIVIPTGREFHYPSAEVIRNLRFWRPKILNYPVQGFSADLMVLARTSFYRRLKERNSKILLIDTVHDSILCDIQPKIKLDTDPDSWYNIAILMRKVFDDVPENFQRLFGSEFNLPFRVEIQVGINWKWMHALKI